METKNTEVVEGKVVSDSGNLPTKQSASILNMIEKIALMPDDTATSNLERLYEMHKDTLDREAEQAFNQDFAKAQIEMLNNPIVKDAVNDQTRSKYARLEVIDRTIKPIYTRHGFGMIGGTADSPLENHIRVTYDIIHVGGHSERGKFYDCPMDDKGIKGAVNKTKPHARGSATTYGKRYLKCLIWDVITQEDDDGNGGTSDEIGPYETWLVRLDEWVLACDSKTLATFWPKNEKAIIKECGKAKAARICKAAKDEVAKKKAEEG